MKAAEDWIRFLRRYGPIAQNGNMFDEEIRRAAKRTGIKPITFNHPLTERLFRCFDDSNNEWKSIILTGTAGDGKTHLCRQVWEKLGGSDKDWASNEPYVMMTIQHPNKGKVQVHVIRDLSAWVPQQGADWPQEKAKLLLKFSMQLILEDEPSEFFVIAANDGQLIETWRRLEKRSRQQEDGTETEILEIVREDIFDKLLIEGKEEEPGIALKFFNLSQMKSSELFEYALKALLEHERWATCFEGQAAESVTFGPQSPIRRNYELLCEELVQERLKMLFEFCDYNELHVPIREILLLLANAILGHPDCREGLMIPKDVERAIKNDTVSKASLYNNIFGGNLSSTRQESIPVFCYLNLLRIGNETTNRIDNVLIFGETDNLLRPYFQKLIGADVFYGADESYRMARRQYIEDTEGDEDTQEDEQKNTTFMERLVVQRRALFFKIPTEWEDELKLWDLTVFKHVGTYRTKVIQPLKEGKKVERNIVRHLVKGLNRIWVGMLVDRDQEVYLATGFTFSNARVSRLLKEEISVMPRLGQKVEVILRKSDMMPMIQITLFPGVDCSFALTLTRFEFLNQVANGALPNSFSREYYEDVMIFKSQVLAALAEHHKQTEAVQDAELTFCFLSFDELGAPIKKIVEVGDV